MSNAKQLRAKAWNSLKGKYWIAFLATIITGFIQSIGFFLVSYSQEMAELPGRVEVSEMDETMKIGAVVVGVMALIVYGVGVLINTFLGNPAMVGCCNYFIRNTDSKPSLLEIFSGYRTRYGRNVGILLLIHIKVFLWMLLLIVPGIIKAYEYAVIPYIIAEDPEISAKEAFQKAKILMKGNKWRLFKLNLSFFGWELLCIPTLGIGAFFLLPYMDAANAEFYVELKNK